MVRLQSRAPLALGQDDSRVDDFVELADIEHPAPESQPLVPQPAHICRVRIAIVAEMNGGVLNLPDIDRRVVCRRIAQASRTMHLAQRICDPRAIVVSVPGWEGMHDSSQHGQEGRNAVDGQQDVVGDDEVLEP